jgi:hypothetical protein
MNVSKLLVVAAATALSFTALAPRADAQVAIAIGPAPGCPYGYFDYYPYACAPYGYYGPEWFVGGVFIGAGPWFHGPVGFRGHVDNRFDGWRGYHGPMPRPGDRPAAGWRPGGEHFSGNEIRNGRGFVDHNVH